MQVLEIYDKNADLRSHGKNIFKTMENFFANYPLEYRRNYDKNLETLDFLKCDTLDSDAYSGSYDTSRNVIFFSNSNSLGHELFHVASYDALQETSGFESDRDFDQGLLEGMTEYFRTKAYGLTSPDDYSFQVFCVMMLENIPDIFKYYFIPNYFEFIKLFPNKKDIYNLLFSLDEFHNGYMRYLESFAMDKDDEALDINAMKMAIRNTINNLISIELSMNNDKQKLIKYRDKFMDLLGSVGIELEIKKFCPKYYEYAEAQLKRRILER